MWNNNKSSKCSFHKCYTYLKSLVCISQFMHGPAIGESLQLCKIHRNRRGGRGQERGGDGCGYKELEIEVGIKT